MLQIGYNELKPTECFVSELMLETTLVDGGFSPHYAKLIMAGFYLISDLHFIRTYATKRMIQVWLL